MSPCVCLLVGVRMGELTRVARSRPTNESVRGGLAVVAGATFRAAAEASHRPWVVAIVFGQ